MKCGNYNFKESCINVINNDITSHHIMLTQHHVMCAYASINTPLVCRVFRMYCLHVNVPFPRQGIETKHKIQCRVCALFLYLIFALSSCLIQPASVTIFSSCHCRTPQAVLETIFP